MFIVIGFGFGHVSFIVFQFRLSYFRRQTTDDDF